MRQRILGSLTYANVVSTLCLFIVLGGSSYAAVQLKKNSVRSKHIKNGAVRAADLSSNAVASSEVRDGSLLAQDFRAGQLPAGAPGPQGQPGAQGPTGPQGPPGMSGWEEVVAEGTTETSVDLARSASCPEGKRVVGGGFRAWRRAHHGPDTRMPVPVKVYYDGPDTERRWSVFVNFSGSTKGPDELWALEVSAICVDVAP